MLLMSVLAVTGAVGLIVWGYVRLRDNERREGKKGSSPPVTDVRARMSAHEAGHAIVAWYSTHVRSVDSIFIGKNGEGKVDVSPDYKLSEADMSALVDHAVIKLAGCAGELLLFDIDGFNASGIADDMQGALQAVARLVHRQETDVLVSQLDGHVGTERPRFYVIDSSLTPLEADCLAAAYLEARRRIIEHAQEFEELWETLVLMSPGTMPAETIAAFFGEPRHWAPK